MLERLLRTQSRAFVLVGLAWRSQDRRGIVAADRSVPASVVPARRGRSGRGSRPADQTALTVTRPVEEAIRAIRGRDVRSRRREARRRSRSTSVGAAT
jgi:hypothetical protein